MQLLLRFHCLAILSAMVHSTSLPAYRLPPTVVPRHYDLDIITNLDEDNFSFQGNALIKVECLEETDTIIVHSRDLTLTGEKVSLKTGEGKELTRSLAVTSTQHDTENEFYVVKIGEKLAAGQVYSLYLPFQGQLTGNLIGYYRSSYVDQASNTKKWLAVTYFEPSDARQAFPCFDEPGMKATFTIRLAHKDDYSSVSNMPLKNTTPFEGRPGWVWDEFETTVPMSTYLIAYMVSELEFQQSAPLPNGVQFRVWARPDAIKDTDFACRVGPRFQSFYEDFLGIKYPLPKQDLLAIPDYKIGAMENWGIITFKESYLLVDEKMTSNAAKLAASNTIAHELAHMWFGNLVTMKWWTDLWLKEGFATYMASLSVHHEFPDWNSLDSSAVSDLLNVFYLDSLKSSHPVSVPIGHPREIVQIFDTISYEKGSFLLRMMSLFLGEEVFRQGVSKYLKKHEFGNAEQDDLWAALTVQAHQLKVLPAEVTVKRIMDTWTLQTGYPLITVTRDYGNNTATVSQRRYLAVQPECERAEACEERWWVPLSYSTAKELRFDQTQPQQWLSGDERSAQLDLSSAAGPNDWLVLNNRAAGLFRVNYDVKNWELLAEVLNSGRHSTIGVLNRVQLLIDAMDLANRGDISYELALRIAGYLRNETQLLPWTVGLAKLGPIKTILCRTANFGVFKNFLRSLMTAVVSSLGKLTQEPESFEHSQLLSQVTLWACPLDIGDCASQASQLFDQWRTATDPDTTNPIPKDVRHAVYSHAVKQGGEEVWNFLWQRYKNTNLFTEKNNLMAALSATHQVWLLNRYLEWTLDESSGIRMHDAFIIFSRVARQEVGYYVALKFFFRNIKRISEYYGDKSNQNLIGRYIGALAEQMIYPHELDELKRFLEKHKELLSFASLAVAHALETVQININWMDKHYNTISAAMDKVSSTF